MTLNKDQQHSSGQKDNSNTTPGKNLPYALRSFLHNKIEGEMFSQHKIFIRSANHLHQIKFLTWNEINRQHEFYPYEESFFDKFSALFNKKVRVPNSPEVNNYIAYLRKTISQEIDSRLKEEMNLKEEMTRRRQMKDAEEQREEKDDSFYLSHPEYNLYENHLGETRWMTKEERERQDEFTEEVNSGFTKILHVSKWVFLALLVFAAIFYFLKPDLFNPTQRGYLLVFANVKMVLNQLLNLSTLISKPRIQQISLSSWFGKKEMRRPW